MYSIIAFSAKVRYGRSSCIYHTSITTQARDFKFAGAPVQRLQLAMVALTQKWWSAQCVWFSHRRSHFSTNTCPVTIETIIEGMAKRSLVCSTNFIQCRAQDDYGKLCLPLKQPWKHLQWYDTFFRQWNDIFTLYYRICHLPHIQERTKGLPQHTYNRWEQSQVGAKHLFLRMKTFRCST